MEDLKDKKYLSLVPWKIILCFIFGFCIVYFFPILAANKDDYLVLMTGLIAAQGIMLGMSTNAIQHIVQNISTPGFSSFLEENNILPYYLLFIQYFQITGILSLIVLIITSILLISVANSIVLNVFFALSFSFVLYSLIQTAETSVLLRDVVFYRSRYDATRCGS